MKLRFHTTATNAGSNISIMKLKLNRCHCGINFQNLTSVQAAAPVSLPALSDGLAMTKTSDVKMRGPFVPTLVCRLG
ncbi:uncharacterized protein UV8b_03161 [Ustilaginoidea virens]|uniref:Uncharacterized protein n=1 Tax=Ustilaginoidea virens TaxID=1159556 RepID=A0A8E5HNV2_USTVR|nr:uncharacterized protein UV8b_03161 [Ustilaginoidea virens]QUC18920.1 hypothetical protein UV8b_03161 [Ustilaginoidea virens]